MDQTCTQKTPNKLSRYYVCVNGHQRGYNQCPMRSVSAPIEQAVIEAAHRAPRTPCWQARLRSQPGPLPDGLTADRCFLRLPTA